MRSACLPAVREVAGVGKLVASQEDPEKTIVRIRGYAESPKGFSDCTWCLMILEAYGPNLESFESGLHLLEAFQDLVMGKRYSLSKPPYS